ncbi:MAG: YicC family protein, partial [Deltaproteobacteria bacterium]|nr:YicC family protein [Deltaproteobacteria bacterium]
MRPRSMTGFGRGEASEADQTWTVEIRTVNHRFLDQRVVLPRAYGALEERVKKTVAAGQDRGRVEVSLALAGSGSTVPRL